MNDVKCLISIGAEGGFIELYGKRSELTYAEFRVTVVDQTSTFLDDDEGGAPSKRDSGWLPNWSAAIAWLSRYPWPHLAGLHVDPSVADDVWAALQAYIARGGSPVRGGRLQRWREVCRRSSR
jgi:hypothetical protein